jgi:hypothetical protein
MRPGDGARPHFTDEATEGPRDLIPCWGCRAGTVEAHIGPRSSDSTFGKLPSVPWGRVPGCPLILPGNYCLEL